MNDVFEVLGVTNATPVGSGGSATVYRAFQPELERWVAVKVIHGVADEATLRRFDREAKALGRLSDHPGIITVHSTGSTDAGLPYLVMQYCEGGSLQSKVAAEGPMTPDHAARSLQPVAETLSFVHQNGVSHRDVKPANILLDGAGNRLVADFGIAVFHGMAGVSKSQAYTIGYAPPESVLEDSIADSPGDVYSLGATLYHACSGSVPFTDGDEHPTNGSVIARMSRGDLTPAAAFCNDGELATLITRAMSDRPANRPSMTEVAEALRAIVAGSTSPLAVATVMPTDRTIDRSKPGSGTTARKDKREEPGETQPAESNNFGIEGFTDLAEIGTGGFSKVYSGFDQSLRRTVALKVLEVTLDDAGQRLAFENECQLMAQVSDHPNIATIHAATFTGHGQPVIVMEYFAAGTLETAVVGDERLTQSLDAGVKLASALSTAHKRGILHMDVKPKNVLVSSFGEPSLSDFGIALTSELHGDPTTHALSLHYAAPERLGNAQPTAASDVYSLGATLYRTLTGKRPYATDGRIDNQELVRRVLGAEPPPLTDFGLPLQVDEIVRQRAMARRPEDRYESAAEFGTALRTLQSNLGIAVTPWVESSVDFGQLEQDTPTDPDQSGTVVRVARPRQESSEKRELAPKPTRKRPGWRTLVAIAGLALLVGVIAVLALTNDTEPDVVPGDDPPTIADAPRPADDGSFSGTVAAPQNVTVLREGSEVAVRWTTAGNPPGTQYELYRRDTPELGSAVAVTDSDEYILTGIPLDVVPCVEIVAVAPNGLVPTQNPITCLDSQG